MKSNRRDFLKSASILAASGLIAGKTSIAGAREIASPKAVKNFGLQIYSLGREFMTDVPGGLKKVAEMGYATIELAGVRDGKAYGMELKEFRKAAEDVGLKITSSHVNPPVNEYKADNRAQITEYWKKTVADHVTLGCKYLIQPGLPQTRSVEEVKYVCEVFNEAGQISKAAGVQWGYHNHDFEYAYVTEGGTQAIFGRRGVPRGAKTIYDLFLENTDPALVVFENDVYWTVMGQHDPLEYILGHKDRIRLLHIKDKEVLGQSGMMNFENIFKAAYSTGIQDFFVELEGFSGGQFVGVKGCADYLLNAPFVK
ncbi:MAG: sugar phosphate isomerase/epimerase [Tannerella sp.]|jgi:sugar phosphate isomerase/epimerase|nr:sugar phosphate isomerase/epimerase [Tannerella sp.]